MASPTAQPTRQPRKRLFKSGFGWHIDDSLPNLPANVIQFGRFDEIRRSYKIGKDSPRSGHYHQLAGLSRLEVVQMAVRLGGRAIREIRTLFDSGVIGSWSDKQLLAQVSTGGEGSEAALRVLINRHAPMVMGICRRVLGNEAVAEDAFQATFLVLVRKADSLGSYEMLADWIYGRAPCRQERPGQTARCRVVERQAAHSRPGWRSEEFEQAELRSVIDDAIASLPERFRVPVILCYLEGLRHEEIAQRLGCPIGTVESRLSRARNQLRQALPSGAIALGLDFGGGAWSPTSLIAGRIRRDHRADSQSCWQAVF